MRAAWVAVFLPLLCCGPARAQWGGPDAFGYQWSDTITPVDGQEPAYAWNPITGTQITLGDDQLSAGIALPFTFQFYGTSYATVYISSNGFISFTNDSQGCCSGVNPPNASIPNGFAAFHWNDMYPPSGGTIKWTTGGSSPNQYFVSEFINIGHCCGGTNPASVQCWLYETSNDIVVQMLTMTSDGSQTTIGIENAAGTQGLLYQSSSTSGTFKSNEAVRFYLTPAGTPTETHTATATPTSTVTWNPSFPTYTTTDTPVWCPTRTLTDTRTSTPTRTRTATRTDSPTATRTHTHTATPTETATPTDTRTATDTVTATRTATNTPTATATVINPHAFPNPATAGDDVYFVSDAKAGEKVQVDVYNSAGVLAATLILDSSGPQSYVKWPKAQVATAGPGVFVYRIHYTSRAGVPATYVGKLLIQR